MKNGVILKKGKEAIFENRHQWIFSGAIESFPEKITPGGIYPVYRFDQQLLGYAYFNPGKSLAGRIISFSSKDPILALGELLEKALNLRENFFDPSLTNAYRLVNGEGDGIPGLVVDQYDDALVIQSGTLGIDLLKGEIVSFFVKKNRWNKIFEKSTGSSRKEEGLPDSIGVLYGEDNQEIIIKENGIKFSVKWREGQKTGFFLDQREMRELIRAHSHQKRVLNCFSYSGGFTAYALAGGAIKCDSVDISSSAIEMVKRNLELNHFDTKDHSDIATDAFKFLTQDPLDYDLIILDPPAFAKKKQDIAQASKGYREINTQVLKKIPSNSFLLTCSCSYYIDEALFQTILFQAAKTAKREVKIVSKHRVGLDHPINLYHRESSYLKSLLLYIN